MTTASDTLKGTYMKNITNEDQIKKLLIELKEIDRTLNYYRPLRNLYNEMLEAKEIYSDLNIDAGDIERELEQLGYKFPKR